MDAALIGHWKMETIQSGGILPDETANANHADMVSVSGVTTTTGQFGNGISLTGTTGRYAVVTHNSSLNVNNALTLAGWVNTVGTDYDTMFSKMTTGAVDGFQLAITTTGTNNAPQVTFLLNQFTAGTTARLRTGFAATSQFAFVAATWDGATQKIYINGALAASLNHPTNPPVLANNTLDLYLFANNAGGERFGGIVDEFYFFGRALTSTEITSLYTTNTLPVAATRRIFLC